MKIDIPLWLLVLGFSAQGMFFLRFFVQWLYSEKKRKSQIPLAFWWFSLAGGALMMVYGVYRRDPVIMLGQCFGLLVYSRNLVLIRRHAKEQRGPSPEGAPLTPQERDLLEVKTSDAPVHAA